MKNHIVGLIVFIMIFLSVLYISCKKSGHYELSRFVPPETCGTCHDEIYSQWKGSMHSLAHNDSLYREVALHDLKGLTDPDELKEAELCVKCHTPIGYVSGLPAKTSDHVKKIPEIATKGVQCDFCHSVTGVAKPYNASLTIDPGHGEADPGTKRGPFSDSHVDIHKSAYSALHTSSKICGACHDVRHVVFGTKLETPYEEWEKSPYAHKGIPCQGCHMYQRPGIPATGSTARPDNPGRAAQDGPIRKHIFTHYFIGTNVLIPTLSGNILQKRMAQERLRDAATVTIGDRLADGAISITVKNAGAGHSIPTGLTHIRHVWLEVKVSTMAGVVLLHSGKLDGAGRLDPSTIVYNTVFGDAAGKPVMNVAKARSIIKDYRIKPMESAVEVFRLPGVKDKPLRIEAKLWHRLAPQELVDSVLGAGRLKIPAVLMASDAKIIKP